MQNLVKQLYGLDAELLFPADFISSKANLIFFPPFIWHNRLCQYFTPLLVSVLASPGKPSSPSCGLLPAAPGLCQRHIWPSMTDQQEMYCTGNCSILE